MPHKLDSTTVSTRIDRLPSSWPIWAGVWRLSFGGFFEIYEVSLTVFLTPALVSAGIFQRDGRGILGLPDLATFAFGTFAGIFLGSLIFSAISDRIGRRQIFTLSLILYSFATVVMSFQNDAISICFWRFLAAIGVGAEVVAIDSYLSEFLPKHMRGRGFAISKSIQYCAVPVTGILSIVLQHRTINGVDGWRILTLLPAFAAVAIWFVRRGLPESPRWLAEHGRIAEAEKIVSDIETKVRKSIGDELPPPEVARAPVAGLSLGYAALWRDPLRARMIMLFVASAANAILFYGFSNWLPSLLAARGVSASASLAYSAVIAFGYPLSPLFFALFADKMERKWQISIGALISAVGGLAFAIQHAVAGWIICGVLVTVANNLVSFATHTYRSELFPTSLRARAIGMVYAVDRTAAALSGYIVAVVLVQFGVTAVFFVLACASIVNFLVVALFGPRTTGLAVEEITHSVLNGTIVARKTVSRGVDLEKPHPDHVQ